jgi:hypothetical protein
VRTASAVQVGRSFLDYKELATPQAWMMIEIEGADALSLPALPGIPDSGHCRLSPLPDLSIGFRFEAVQADGNLPNQDSELAWYRVAFQT